MSAEVFISYASKDRDRILDLVDRLDAAGVSVWIDQMSIEGATMWSQEIVAAIRNCKVLILAISENSADSENVVKELALASEGRKRILPVYLESAEIPESMAYQLAGIQRVEFFEEDEEAGQQSVIRALAKLGVTVSKAASTAAAGAPKRTSHGASHAPSAQAPKSEGAAWGKMAAAVGGVAVLTAGIFFLGGSGSEPTSPLGQAGTNTTEQAKPLAKPVTLDTNRVVVLPFKTIGGAQDSEDLGYGLVSTLTSKLQPLQSLVIIANESARKFKDTELSPKEIGQALQVGTIVTGEIQTSGDKMQVNIRVIDANTEALGWGSTFTKIKDEFLDLQNEIATQLASELKGGLDAAEAQQLAQKATENAEAQAEYQAGLRVWNLRTKEGFYNAIKRFERAIELDENYAQPYAGLADTYHMMVVYNFADVDEAMQKAKAYAKLAIEKNSRYVGGYISMAWIQHNHEWKWKESEENFRKAIKLNPNYATGNQWFSIHLSNTGKHAEGIKYAVKATELHPESMIIKLSAAQIHYFAGENETALHYCNEASKIDPYFSTTIFLKYAKIYDSYSEEDVAHIREAIRLYPDQPMNRKVLSEVLLKQGNREAALEQLILLLEGYHDTMNKAHFAETFFVMGMPEQGYRWLEKAIEAREGWAVFYGTFPSLKKYQQEPRFRELYKKIDHPLYVD